MKKKMKRKWMKVYYCIKDKEVKVKEGNIEDEDEMGVKVNRMRM